MRVLKGVRAWVRVMALSRAGQMVELEMLKGSMTAKSMKTKGMRMLEMPKREERMVAEIMMPRTRRGPRRSEMRPALREMKM